MPTVVVSNVGVTTLSCPGATLIFNANEEVPPKLSVTVMLDGYAPIVPGVPTIEVLVVAGGWGTAGTSSRPSGNTLLSRDQV